MGKIRIALGIGLAGAVVVVTLPGAMPPDALAAKNPAKASAKCRRTIGLVALKAVTAGLRTIQQCHLQQAKGRSTGNCNSLSGAAFDRAKEQAIARMNVACKAGDPVAANYNSPTVSEGFRPVLDIVRTALEESGAALQAAVTLQGDAKSLKAKRKCNGTLGLGRTLVVQGVLKSAVNCQQRIDKHAQSFGPIDPSCVGGAGGAGSRASGKVGKACGAFSGAEVGSCDGLPGCLVTAAEATGQRIARLVYGGPAVCGNGIQDVGEGCDDGNTVGGDGCEANCELPLCGDLIVNQPSEECDDPDGLGGDDPTENCYQCKLNVCGDGLLDRQEPVLEECDGSVDQACPGRCTPQCTCGPILCGANGLTATLALDYDKATLGGVSATRLELAYPPAVSIPGSGFAASVRQRVTSLLSSDYNFLGSDQDANTDGVDDLVRADVRAPAVGSINPGPIAQVQFDCAAGTPVLPADLPCTIQQLVMLDGSPFPPELSSLARCVVTPAP